MDKKLIDRVIDLEWKMFSSVPNSGYMAGCQTDLETFKVMRLSQQCEWPEELLASYYDDLVKAEREERNLMTEKYAWMMESTFPDEFREIAHLLTVVDEDTVKKIEEIVSVNVAWKLAACEAYPKLGQKGRAVRSSEDSPHETSFETYLRGELKTYSSDTIALLHKLTMSQKADGINGVERTLLHQVRQYGYSTLEQAEQQQ